MQRIKDRMYPNAGGLSGVKRMEMQNMGMKQAAGGRQNNPPPIVPQRVPTKTAPAGYERPTPFVHKLDRLTRGR